MADLNSILNYVIPIGVVGIFAALLYTKMKEPINQFFRWIGRTISWAVGKTEENMNVAEYETVYKYG